MSSPNGYLNTYSPANVIQSGATAVGGSYSGYFAGGFGYIDPPPWNNVDVVSPTWYLQTPYTSDFNLSLGNCSIEADVNFLSFTNDMVIVAKDTYGTNFDWGIWVTSSTTVEFWTNLGTNRLIVTVPTFNTNQWYHIKFERASGVNTLYVDGTPYGTSSFSITNASQVAVTVGCSSYNNPGSFVHGYLDNVKIVNGVTTVLDLGFEDLGPSRSFFTDDTGKILTIMHPIPMEKIVENESRINTHVDIVRSGLINWYDTVNINSYDRVGPEILDLTGNGHTGTLTGATFMGDAGISFDGITGSLIYDLTIPAAMTHIIYAKSNQSTWTNYNGLGANRGNNGWSMYTWQGLTDISMGWNDNLGNSGVTLTQITPPFDITLPHMYAITTNGSNAHSAWLDNVKHPMLGTITRTGSTVSSMWIANDAPPYTSRHTDLTVYVHLLYNRSLTDDEMLQNYNALKTIA